MRYGRDYDHGLRGFRDTVRYDGGYRDEHRYRGRDATPRVTQAYNREYVHPDPWSRPRNPNPYGGDAPERIVDAGGYWRPYMTTGGTRTLRGGGLPVGWEREVRGRGYDRGYDGGWRGYGRDLYGPMR